MSSTNRQGLLSEDGRGENSLFIQSIQFSNDKLLKDLLRGAAIREIDTPDSLGRTPLYHAVIQNAYVCARLLLEAGGEWSKEHF